MNLAAAGDISQLVILGVLAAAAIWRVIAMLKSKNGNGKGDRDLCRLTEAIEEQTELLREIGKQLLGMGYEQRGLVAGVARLESSLTRYHDRLHGAAPRT